MPASVSGKPVARSVVGATAGGACGADDAAAAGRGSSRATTESGSARTSGHHDGAEIILVCVPRASSSFGYVVE